MCVQFPLFQLQIQGIAMSDASPECLKRNRKHPDTSDSNDGKHPHKHHKKHKHKKSKHHKHGGKDSDDFAHGSERDIRKHSTDTCVHRHKTAAESEKDEDTKHRGRTRVDSGGRGRHNHSSDEGEYDSGDREKQLRQSSHSHRRKESVTGKEKHKPSKQKRAREDFHGSSPDEEEPDREHCRKQQSQRLCDSLPRDRKEGKERGKHRVPDADYGEESWYPDSKEDWEKDKQRTSRRYVDAGYKLSHSEQRPSYSQSDHTQSTDTRRSYDKGEINEDSLQSQKRSTSSRREGHDVDHKVEENPDYKFDFSRHKFSLHKIFFRNQDLITTGSKDYEDFWTFLCKYQTYQKKKAESEGAEKDKGIGFVHLLVILTKNLLIPA